MIRAGRRLAVAAVVALVPIAGPVLPASPGAGRAWTGVSVAAAAQTTTTVPATTTTVAAATPGADGLGDSFYPKMGNGGYDVAHYDIDLDVDPAQNTIEAVTTITAAATQSLSSFNLDFTGLVIEGITVNGRSARFSRAGTELTVTPAAPLVDGSEFTVAVTYSGTPLTVDDPATNGRRKVGWHWYKGDPYPKGMIFVYNGRTGAPTWFPNNNHPSDKATFEFEIRVPDGVVGFATGTRVSEATAGGYTTSTWKMDDPMATFVAAVYVGDFVRSEVRVEGKPLIRNYVHRGVSAPALSETSAAMDVYERLLGPYPFDAYGTVVVPFRLWFAYENQSLSVHGTSTVIDRIIAHELAHQWFGNASTQQDWTDIWLSEGFAKYMEFVYMAHKYRHVDSDLMRRYMEWIRGMVVRADVPAPKKISVDQLLNTYAVYHRGALTLHALRKQAGDTKFWQIMRAAHSRTSGANTSTETFLGIVREFAGEEAVQGGEDLALRR